jgi:hypothetical protein
MSVAEWSSGAESPSISPTPRRWSSPSTSATRSAISFAFGKGKAVYLAPANARDPHNTQRLSRILDNAGVKPPYPALRTDGRPANDVETRIFRNGERRSWLSSATTGLRRTQTTAKL